MSTDNPEIARLMRRLEGPTNDRLRDVLRRRIFAIEHDIAFTNPFGEVDETLYRIWR